MSNPKMPLPLMPGQRWLNLETGNEVLRNNIRILQNAKIWVTAAEGETLENKQPKYAQLKSLELELPYVAQCTDPSITLQFPGKSPFRIYPNSPIDLLGNLTLTTKIIDAFIELFESELVPEDFILENNNA